MTILETIEEIRSRDALPDPVRYSALLETGTFFLEQESPGIRPTDSSGLSGGLVRLKKNIPTLILPDLHGRKDFFSEAMNASLTAEGSVLDALKANALQVLCLGDGFHTEHGTRARWLEAFGEYREGYDRHAAMDAEMRDSLGLMEMVIVCKTAFPDNFHFLKGNHENILNEEGNGNHAFMKIAYEGDMVRSWTEKFFGEEFLYRFSRLEKSLPLLAVGDTFLASHAEPRTAYAEKNIINARANPDITTGLTWTGNGEAEAGSVDAMLKLFFGDDETAVYLGGHRPIDGLYAYRAGNRFIQIHNPSKKIIALSLPGKRFDPETDVRELE